MEKYKRRNKQWRRCHQWRLFKAKLIILANYHTDIIDKGNVEIKDPHWFEYIGHRWAYKYKTMRKPCSCRYCRGPKYNRLHFKKEARCIIDESGCY